MTAQRIYMVANAQARDVGDGRAYVIGVDWGRHKDFTVIVVIDARQRAVAGQDDLVRLIAAGVRVEQSGREVAETSELAF